MKNDVCIRGFMINKIPHEKSTVVVISVSKDSAYPWLRVKEREWREKNKEQALKRAKTEEEKTAIIEAAEKEESKRKNDNYIFFVSFFDEWKTYVDSLEPFISVNVYASANCYRDKESKQVKPENIMYIGQSIEPMIDFTKRVLSSAGIPIHGLKISDCAEFELSGKILGIMSRGNKADISLGVQNKNGNFDIVPLVYSGNDKFTVQDAFSKYKLFDIISVKGFITQSSYEKKPIVDGQKKKEIRRQIFHVTSFLTSETEFDADNL